MEIMKDKKARPECQRIAFIVLSKVEPIFLW